MFQQLYPHERLLLEKNFDMKANASLSLLGNMVDRFSLSFDQFNQKIELLSHLLHHFPKTSLRSELNLLERHAKHPLYAKFMLMHAYEKNNGPPWYYSIAERDLAFTVLAALIKKSEKVKALITIYEEHISRGYFNQSVRAGNFFSKQVFKYKLHFIAELRQRMTKITNASVIERQVLEMEVMPHPIVPHHLSKPSGKTSLTRQPILRSFSY